MTFLSDAVFPRGPEVAWPKKQLLSRSCYVSSGYIDYLHTDSVGLACTHGCDHGRELSVQKAGNGTFVWAAEYL